MPTDRRRNPHAPRPPMIPELIALPDPEEEEKPEPLFVPDPDLALWVRDNLFHPDSPLLIDDHVDIVQASIGYLWTNVELKRQGIPKGGTAQLGKPPSFVGDAWARGAVEQQRREWFGHVPDLLVTIYAPACARCEGYQVVALIDHELCHFAPLLDKDGEPKVDEETERMAYRIVGHDIEEFAGVAHRWGEWSGGLKRIRGALAHKPYFDRELANRLVGPPLVGEEW